ncbi:hypothetical protein [Photobacterium rosenbergii]|uniref:Uncharacterized protein n=1 Tax=Photobacterium rosenbergii TaxID=294936 RepID=A0ABU3ZIK6_9GAMM|nr:hypothetical protein [Photobacterium rosenbergii]MDV5169949.1 hypothetical protein [Photobacterium rosenbergii]
MKVKTGLSLRLCLPALVAAASLLGLMGCESSMFARSYDEPPINRQYMELYRTSEMLNRPPPEIYQYPRPPFSEG